MLQMVPDDRLLLESDIDTAGAVDEEVRTMAAVIAEAKGWSIQEVARRTRVNAERFVACRPV